MVRLKIFLSCLFLFFFSGHYVAGVFAAEEAREDCRVCSMWIDQYMHTRHVLTEANGSRVSFCSFACAAKYIKKHEIDVKQLQAADYLTAELVDVGDTVYLVGSEAPPVMGYTSIIAFANIETAKNFQNLHGGKIMTFDEVFSQY